jgi:hypothetical protein
MPFTSTDRARKITRRTRTTRQPVDGLAEPAAGAVGIIIVTEGRGADAGGGVPGPVIGD